jgi:hypothetical protein
LVALGILVSGASSADRSPDTIDVSRFPPKYQQAYKLVEIKCSKCHSLAHAMDRRMSADFWRSYIKKMSRLQGSGINERTGEVLLDFLIYFSQSQNAPDAGTK